MQNDAMKTNVLPKYDMKDTPTNCCPKFRPEPWDERRFHFNDKLFVKTKTISFFHIPLNINSVYKRVFADIEQAGALDNENFVALSYDPSPWRGEHYFSVIKDVPDHDMVKLSGNYLTKVFEGPYQKSPQWIKAMKSFIKEKGHHLKKLYFFYTTCPRCAKVYGKNYVVGIAEI